MDSFGLVVSPILLAAVGFTSLLPIIIIGSNRTTGGEKAARVLAVIFVPWFAWVFYMLLAPIKTRD